MHIKTVAIRLLCVLIQLLKIVLGGKRHYHPCFLQEETETQCVFLPQVIQYIHTQTRQKWIELHRFHRETGRKKLINIDTIKFYTAVERKEEVCVGEQAVRDVFL